MRMTNTRDRLVSFLVYAVLTLFTAGLMYAAKLTLGGAGTPGAGSIPEPVKNFMLAVSTTLSLNLGAYFGISAVVAHWENEPIGYLQKVACWVYVVELVGAAVVWAFAGFAEEAPLLPAIVSTGLGVVLAVFGAALGVKLPAVQERLKAAASLTPQ